VLSSLCETMLDRNMFPGAVEACRRAGAVQPESADRAMFSGIALHRSGEMAAAEGELKDAIRLDPSLKHAYVELWTLYDEEKKKQAMTDIGSRFLDWNPQNIMFRVLQESSAVKP
jgi:Flp pilus assembly protein TadD